MRTTFLLAAGCAGADADAVRAAWLVDVVHQDNLVWRSRDPALLAEKYERMAADPYDWMRGSATVFLRDLERAGTDRLETAFVGGKETAEVAIVGDPHPENLGLFAVGLDEAPAEPALLLEVADLDGAGFGPYLVDVRRALLGMATLLDGAGCDRDCREPVLEAEAEAWAEELDAIDEGDPPFVAGVPAGSNGGALGLVIERARDRVVERGEARIVYGEATEPGSSGHRRFRVVAAPDEAGEGLVHPTPEERAELDRLLARLEAPAGFRVLDRARRYGIGVASLPAVRYAVLWDRGDPSDDDDALLQLREVVDPPWIPGLRTAGTYDSQADRIVSATLAAWSRPDVDPWLQAVTDGARTFKVLSWSSWDETLDHARIAGDFRDGVIGREDLEELGEVLGRHLGSLHARALTADGLPAIDALIREVDDREDAFVREQVEAAERDLQATLRDHRLFVRALRAGAL